MTLRLALAALLFHLLLALPSHPAGLVWSRVLLLSVELPVILLGLVALGSGRLTPYVRGALVATLGMLLVLKAANFGMFTALNRGFNLVSDMPLVGSLYDLLVGALGQMVAGLAVVGGMLGFALAVVALWWASGVWSRVTLPKNGRRIAGAAALLCSAVMVVDVGAKTGRWEAPVALPASAPSARLALQQFDNTRETLAELRVFNAAAQDDPFAGKAGLYDLVDRDVLVVFIESYGRTSFDTPLYADLHRATLNRAEAELSALGLSTATTFLTSPTRGGQSWLAHSTFANGLWISNQTSYRAALTSGRQTLFHLAQAAGFHTAAVMPQIIMDWPEADLMGFDTVLAAEDLGYKGMAFNWITMPDQFTFAAMDRLLREERPEGARAYFIQMALGSSHAPWVPVPDVISWDAVGDGTVFNPIVEASDTPRVVWKDRDRVRAQYRLAVDYALQTVFAYAALHAADPPLMIIVGDHQAAGFVALEERSDVPMHIVGPAHLVERLARTGFHAGLLPPSSAEPRPMNEMRAYILQALSSAQIATSAE